MSLFNKNKKEDFVSVAESLNNKLRAVSKTIQETEELIQNITNLDKEKKDALDRVLEISNEQLSGLVKKHPVYQQWLQYVPGIDGVLAGHILGRINWSNVESQYQVVKYAHENRFLAKKIANATKYMINKKSPYAIYFKKQMIICDKTTQGPESHKVVISKKFMTSAFLIDLYYMYNGIVYNDEIKMKEFPKSLAYQMEIDRTDFYITNQSAKNIAKYKLALDVYKYRLSKMNRVV